MDEQPLTIVLARDYQRGVSVARAAGLVQPRTLVVSRPERLHGLDGRGWRVLFESGFWERRDAQEISEYLRVMGLPAEDWQLAHF